MARTISHLHDSVAQIRPLLVCSSFFAHFEPRFQLVSTFLAHSEPRFQDVNHFSESFGQLTQGASHLYEPGGGRGTGHGSGLPGGSLRASRTCLTSGPDVRLEGTLFQVGLKGNQHLGAPPAIPLAFYTFSVRGGFHLTH